MSQLTIRPSDAGDETNQWFQDTGAPGDNRSSVDEAVHDDDATRNGAEPGCTDDQWYRDLYAMENCGLAAGTTINFIDVYMFINTNSGYGKTAIKSGGVVYEGSEQQSAAVYAAKFTHYTTIGGAAITPAMIDAIQAGSSLKKAGKANYARNTQTYIVVDYTLAAAGKVQAHVLG